MPIRPYKSLVLAVALAAAGASAQDNTLESIVVTADRQQSVLRDLSSSITTVNAEALKTVQAVHINEALMRVPGTWVSRGNGQEHLTAIRSPVLSGAGSCGSFQMSQDGIPLHGVGFCNVNQLFEANSEQAGAVEVIRGPGSVLFGANALHGSINVISAPVQDETGGSLSLEAGSYGYKRVLGSLNVNQGAHGLRLDANGTSDEGYKHDSGYDQQKFTLSHRYRGNGLTATTVLNGSNLNQETAGYVEGFEAYKDAALKKFNPNPEAYRDVQSLRLHSRIDIDLSSGMLSLTPYFRRMDMDFAQHFLPGVPLEENGHDSFGLQTMYSQASGPLQWMAGIDYEYSDGYLRETQFQPADPDNAFLNATLPIGRHYDYEVVAQMISPYAQLRWELGARDQLNLGLRYEWREYDYDNAMSAGRLREDGTPCPMGGCRYSRPADRSDDFDNVSAQIGWIHDFDDSQQLYVNVARAFRVPETSEMYRLQNAQVVADLDSEELLGVELGYRATRGSLSYSAALYHMDKDNVIFQDSDRNNVSGGETRHKGVEFGLDYALSDTLRWQFAASYARHHYGANIAPQGVTVNIDGNEIDTSPKWTGSSQLLWEVAAGHSLEAEWVHMGSYYTNEANTNKYEGHDLLNLRWLASLPNNWNLGLRVTNLLDRDYAERADFGFGNDRYFVGQPRSWYLTLGTSF